MRNLGYNPPPCFSKHPIVVIPSVYIICEPKRIDMRDSWRRLYARLNHMAWIQARTRANARASAHHMNCVQTAFCLDKRA